MRNQFILTPFFLDEASTKLELLAQPDWHINKPILPDGDKQQRMSTLYHPITEFVANTLAKGDRPVSIAGDCCTTLGVLAGLQKARLNPVLLWLDAHGDFNTWETTPSGFLGGMPLAMLVGRGEQTMMKVVGLHPIPEAQVILTDGRDLDPAEKQALAKSGVHHIVDSRFLLNHPLVVNPLYLHFDADIVNPNDAPAMSYRAQGGPSSAELQTIFRSLAKTGWVVAVSMATWNPKLDADGRSQAVCMELLHSLIDQ
ncbi:MAG: arginase family protein [Bacteroidales bacterium]|nr:arginase family protein [Bacteroidales bacterium]